VPARLGLLLLPAVALLWGAVSATAATRVAVDREGLRVTQDGRVLLEEAAAPRLGFRAGGVWHSATRVVDIRTDKQRLTATLSTDTGRQLRLEVSARPYVRLRASVSGGQVEAMRIGFRARPGERYLGFGERSNAVDQRGREVVNYVQEGPYRPGEYGAVRASIPSWALFERPDATYFPMPWLLSTAGYGVLVDNLEQSRFRLGSQRRGVWSVEVDAPVLRLRAFAGRPARLVRRLTEVTGRQPPPAAPWQLGPWFQTGHQNTAPGELGHLDTLRRRDAPVSAAETHMRYMPCGADVGQEAPERTRTRGFHRRGVAVLTYTREAVCREYEPAFLRGVRTRAFLRRADGSPYTFSAFVGGRVTDVAMIDFSGAAGPRLHGSLLQRTVDNGYDGWMEDYGEYVPPDSQAADGSGGARMHNRYPVLYHRSGQRFVDAAARPLVRFVRSGWTGIHPYAQVVWGGDPATAWGFDGLRSSVTQALSMGLSGISSWGSDVGGFFTLGAERLTPELLRRWIQLGAVSGVMRTKAEGIGSGQDVRPQVWQRQVLPAWRRYAKLRTQLYPYLVAADRHYRRSGMPIMRHLALAHPGDRRAVASDDAFLFGPDLLAAPVTEPGARRRRLYLPRGHWVDLWRSASYERSSGGLELGGARLVRGGRRITLPAPLDELPLLARAGTLLPLLSPDVDTLAGYGNRGVTVGLRERRNRLVLLAFPRGRSSAGFGADGRLRSREGAGRWTLRLRARRPRAVRLEAALATLRRPFTPRSVRLNGRELERSAWRWSPRERVLRVRFRAERGVLSVSAHRD
jgi:sulfoquinovosidase